MVNRVGYTIHFSSGFDEHSTGCYRCLYPTPPKVAMSCAENGVVGVVPGVIGCLQAMETVKVITGVGEPLVGVQCFYDAYDGQFRRLKIGKKRNPDCLSCGDQKTMALDASLLGEGVCSDDTELVDSLGPEFRVSTEEFSKVRNAVGKEGREYVLLDTRAATQFEMVHFPEAVNIPTAQVMKQEPNQVIERLRGAESKISPSVKQTFVICRRGVDSVKVTKWLVDHGIPNVFNINGGYTEYAKEDPTFPMY